MSIDVNEILKRDIVQRHSFFQLKYFVIGKEATPQGKMWQCLREIRERKSWVETCLVEIEETKDRIDLLDIEKEKNALHLSTFLSTERNENLRRLSQKETLIKGRQIDRQKDALKGQLISLENKIKDYEEESNFYVSEFRQLEQVEPLRPLDDLDAQKEYWTAKLFQEINLKMLLRQSLDPEVIKMILCLNDDSVLKQQVISMLAQSRQAIEHAGKKDD